MLNILKKLYVDLDFIKGDLFSASEVPNQKNIKIWVDKGEWISAAKRAGADSVFFVQNNPVIVFAECIQNSLEKIKKFNRIWSLSRPRILVLASPGEITIYDLAQEPINLNVNQNQKKGLNTLKVLSDVNLIKKELNDFHRNNIESGKIFEQNIFGDLRNRADKALIRDLKIVRRELIEKGLDGNNIKYVHSLIARSIFIRYLEDRGVLTGEYFKKIAQKKNDWLNILKGTNTKNFSSNKSLYPKVLNSKELTYAVFETLADDFNGDMFQDIQKEQMSVKEEHLRTLQGLLYGDAGIQKKLFFYSYQFDIVPLDLISSIYEEFYHSLNIEKKKNRKARLYGAFFTPPVLTEFVLSKVLTPKELKKNPRILDPSCGSGIFLVEAFHRIVRYKMLRMKEALKFDELKEILKNQIAGIEINEEAAKITAFSLCIAMLQYLEPPSIQKYIEEGNQLPNLIASKNLSPNYYHSIFIGDAFDEEKIENNPIWKQKLGRNCIDIIIGNPPWGTIDKKHEKFLIKWRTSNNKIISDKEQSQAFILRTLDFLKNRGKVGMLVSAGVLFKHSRGAVRFREDWFSKVKLKEVFNFIHVRKFFFKETDSPFLFIHFEKGKQGNSPILYASAKQTVILDKTQAILFSKYDYNWIINQDLSDNKLWKINWFGRYLDFKFLSELAYYPSLKDYVDRKNSGQGLVLNPGVKYSKTDLKFEEYLDSSSFKRYVSSEAFIFKKLPEKLYRLGRKNAYYGLRILVKRGIDEKSKPKGQITARYENSTFCFTNDINAIKLSNEKDWKYKIILGILWSSFARYYFFMTSSNWGLWHHEIHLEDELLQIPIVLNKDNPATKKIIFIVDKLQNSNKSKIQLNDSFKNNEMEKLVQKWEKELDEEVFKLYKLNNEQKDLIKDCCEIILPFFYESYKSKGLQSAIQKENISWIEQYAKTFSKRWNPYLNHNQEIKARVYISTHENMVAIEFYPSFKNSNWSLKVDSKSLGYILEKIGSSTRSIGVSEIVLDELVYVVSKFGIIIIKRNEKRFWTKSYAREDADATLERVMEKGIKKFI